MNFPWDCFILFVRLMEKFGPDYQLIPLSAPALFRQRILHPFAISRFWSLFCREATFTNFKQLAEQGASILVNPEGVAGISKGFDKRYRLQNFSTSFVRIALQYDRDIVPIYTVNGEYLNPFAYKIEWLNSFVQKFGIPFIALGMTTPLYLIFPFALYIALPARLRYVMGEKIPLKEFNDKPFNALSLGEIREVTVRVHQHMQRELDIHVAEHGKIKFAPFELWKSVRALGIRSLGLLPFAWPFALHSVENNEKPAAARVKSWVTALTLILPVVGWPIFLIYLWHSERSGLAKIGDVHESENYSGSASDGAIGIRRLNAG